MLEALLMGKLPGVVQNPATVLLLHFDDVNGSTNIVDECGHILTAHNTASIRTAQSKFGGSSLYTAGSAGNYVSTPDAEDLHLTGDFTIESWLYMNNISTDTVLLDKSLNATLANRCWIQIVNRQVYLKFDGSSGSTAVGPSTAIPAAGQWFHFAITRSGSTVTVWINGVAIGTMSTTASWGIQPARLNISGTYTGGATSFPGYWDDLRIIKNQALYTATFTPPSTPLTVL